MKAARGSACDSGRFASWSQSLRWLDGDRWFSTLYPHRRKRRFYVGTRSSLQPAPGYALPVRKRCGRDPGRPNRRCLVTARAAHAARRGRVPLGSFISRALSMALRWPRNSAGNDFNGAALHQEAQGPHARDRMIVYAPNAAPMGSIPKPSPRNGTLRVSARAVLAVCGAGTDGCGNWLADALNAGPGRMGQPLPANLFRRPPARMTQNTPGRHAFGKWTVMRTRHRATHRSSGLNDQTHVDRCHTRGRNPRGGAGR